MLVGGDKGGTGKTMLARALMDFLDARSIVPRVFDSQAPGGDLKTFYPLAEVVDLAEVRDQMRVFDGLAVGMPTIVDICAGLLSPTLRALDRARLLDDVRAGTVRLVVLHVIGPSIASLNEIADAAKSIGGGAKHFIVKNHQNDTAFDLGADPRYAAQLESLAPVTINVAKLNEFACERIQALGFSFAAFTVNADESRTLRGYVRTWLDDVFSEFDRVGLNTLMAGGT
jgi:hypothetical protein